MEAKSSVQKNRKTVGQSVTVVYKLALQIVIMSPRNADKFYYGIFWCDQAKP